MNGLLNLDSSDTHIHNVEAKRCKVNNDSATYLGHCHLGHIGVKHMKKLHSDGLLESLDYESLGTCEPCLWYDCMSSYGLNPPVYIGTGGG